MTTPRLKTSDDVRQSLRMKQEIALIDVRHEARFAQAHPFFAANLALKHIERDALRRIPRHDTLVVVGLTR